MALHDFTIAASNAIVDALVNLMDAGTGSTTGDIVFYDVQAGTNELGRIDHQGAQPMQQPAFGDSTNRTAALLGVPVRGTAAATQPGPVTRAFFVDRDDTLIFKATVTATGGGGDIEFNTTTWTPSDPIELTSFTVTMPTGTP